MTVEGPPGSDRDGLEEAGAADHRILVVEDDEDARSTLVRILGRLGYRTEEARDGLEAMAKIAMDIDLVVLDANMPRLDGFEVTERLRSDPDHLDLPIVMVTGLDSQADRVRAVEAGVNDFLSKPYDVVELRLRVGWLLRMKRAQDEVKRHREELEQTVERRTRDLRRALEKTADAQRATHEAHLDTIRRLVLAAEYKDRDTAAHIERIGAYCAVLGGAFGMTPGERELLRHASEMHDVGKMGVPDAILLKPGKLDEAEWAIMKRHTLMGEKLLEGSPSDLLELGRVVAGSHHERWDGGGYPRGLAGEEIPLEGRICAVTDVFDALSNDRPYRDALPLETVYEMIEAGRGEHFDPRVVEAFFDHRLEIEEIHERWGEEQTSSPP